ncbi:MAG TPA: hypothetical protein VGL98_14825 [Gammaproteobacteria bacterium]
MLKITVAVLAIALVGSVSAEGWRLDAGSHRAFKRSLEVAKDELSPENVQMLGGALKHIWNEGTKAAEAEQRSYSDKDYFRQIDGLSYEQLVHFTDATYEAALKYNSPPDDAVAFEAPVNGRTPGPVPPQRYRHNETGTFNRSFHNENEPRGGTDLVGVPGQR